MIYFFFFNFLLFSPIFCSSEENLHKVALEASILNQVN